LELCLPKNTQKSPFLAPLSFWELLTSKTGFSVKININTDYECSGSIEEGAFRKQICIWVLYNLYGSEHFHPAREPKIGSLALLLSSALEDI